MKKPLNIISFKKVSFLLLVSLFLFSCSSHKAIVNQNKVLEQNEKTILVPYGSKHILGDIKTLFARAGWKVKESGNANYELFFKSYWQDLCLTNGHFIDYKMSIVDLSDNEDVYKVK